MFQWEVKLSEPWAIEHVREVLSRVLNLAVYFRKWKLELARAQQVLVKR
jgi:hypothetical protein